jgi:hypothetical protein
VTGSDVLILKLIAQKLNFVIVFKFMPRLVPSVQLISYSYKLVSINVCLLFEGVKI